MRSTGNKKAEATKAKAKEDTWRMNTAMMRLNVNVAGDIAAIGNGIEARRLKLVPWHGAGRAADGEESSDIAAPGKVARWDFAAPGIVALCFNDKGDIAARGIAARLDETALRHISAPRG